MSDTVVRSPVASAPAHSRRGPILLISTVAALGGLLFGYDTAVVSGAIGFLTEKFQMSAGMSGWAASSLLVGCMVGSAASGSVSDRFGRKPVLLACAFLFAVSAVASALASGVTVLAWARLFGGVAIGAVSMLSPMYIAEIAPENVRGRLVGLYQLAIVIGILVVFLVNWYIQQQGTHVWNVDYGWRWMFGSLVIPSGLFGVLLLFVPESPRWLFQSGRVGDAQSVLERLNGSVEAQRIVNAMGMPTERAATGELWALQWRRPLLLGVALAVFSQISGINAVMYYAPEIFKATGGSTGSAFSQTIIIGVVNLAFTVVALLLVDRSGRRRLLIAGTAIQTVSLALAGWQLATSTPGWGVLIALVLFVAAFAVSTGPVTWIAISEIFPNRLRGRAMSVAVLCIWGADWAVTQSFPMLKEAVGPAAIFWIYAGCSLFCLTCLVRIMPETKNRSLEEIEASWRSRHLTALSKPQ